MYRTAAQKGFTILELLVYVALLSWFSYLASHCMLQVVSRMREQGKAAADNVQTALAFDLLMRDLRAAPGSLRAWKKFPITDQEAAQIIWQVKCGVKDDDTGWWVDKGNLIRCTGEYDAQKQAWRSKRRVVAARNVQTLNIRMHIQGERVQAVTCALVATSTIEQKVVMRNGYVHA